MTTAAADFPGSAMLQDTYQTNLGYRVILSVFQDFRQASLMERSSQGRQKRNHIQRNLPLSRLNHPFPICL
jgi:hypothetical protein